MITPKGFVLLGSKSGGMRAGAHTKHTKANQPAGPLARASGSCRAVVFRGVVSLSSVDYVYVLAGAQGEHKVILGSLGREATNNE
jgi:hypothetical protein